MAAPRKPGRGRPQLPEASMRILLRKSTYVLWNERKERLGIKGLSNSEFAEILLHQSIEDLRARCQEFHMEGQGNQIQGIEDHVTTSKRELFQSTPLALKSGRWSAPDVSPVVVKNDTDLVVDVTGDTTVTPQQQNIGLSTTTYLQALNPAFASLAGNPFEVKENQESSDEETISELLEYASNSSDTGSKCSDDAIAESEDELRSEDELLASGDHVLSSASDSATLTALDLDVEMSVEDVDDTFEINSPKFGPVTISEHKKVLQSKMMKEFEEMKKCNRELERYQDMLKPERVIVDVEKMDGLFGGLCDVENCQKRKKVVEKKLDAGVLSILYSCENGHCGMWHSSAVLNEKRRQKIFVNSTLLAAAVLVSGNNFVKVSLLAKCLNLNFISQSSFTRIQTEKNLEVLEHLFHSLDIWHKSIKLTVKLTAAARIKGCEALSEWIQPIKNHFWYCAEECGGDADKLKDIWIGVIHHVCGEHEWDAGECLHGPLTHLENEKHILAKDSKPAKELRKIVFDAEWLRSLKFYVYFRHTSNLENFNSMLLKYAPKRIAFSYEVFTGRVLLAALDHNFHLCRNVLEGHYKKVYSKRSRNWRAEPVKEEKTYSHWPVLLSDILYRRAEDKAPAARHVQISDSNPLHLAPTIALKESPATEDLVKARISRFKSQK